MLRPREWLGRAIKRGPSFILSFFGWTGCVVVAGLVLQAYHVLGPVMSALVVVAAVVCGWSFIVWWLGRPPDNRKLKRELKYLAEELEAFILQHQPPMPDLPRGLPGDVADYFGVKVEGLTDELYDRWNREVYAPAQDARTKLWMERTNEMLALYRQNYNPRVVIKYAEVKALGYTEEKLERAMEHPIVPAEVDRIAHGLAVLSERIPSR